MAKNKTPLISASTEHKIEEFAEDLGKLLAQAQNKAEGWLGQRKQVVSHLEGIRDTATNLLSQLGHVSQGAADNAKRGYARTADSSPQEFMAKAQKAGRILSDEARGAIAAAQKKRWAKWRKANKP